MAAEKSVSVSYRVTPEFRELLERAAAHEQRSRTNLLEKLLFDHCKHIGLLPTGPNSGQRAKQGSR